MVPVRVIWPPAGSISPAKHFARVDLPAPFRPTNPMRSPLLIRTATSLTKSLAPARSSTL